MAYYNSKKTELPSVTTLIGRYMNKPYLALWARDLMRDHGIDFENETRIATNIGTMAHEMIEFDLLGLPTKTYVNRDSDQVKHALIAYSAWEKWKEINTIDEVIATEAKLVSEEHSFGGTIDVVLKMNDKITLLDLKTSKTISVEYLIQVAAYGKLWNENFPDRPIERYEILRIDKHTGKYDYEGWSELEKPWKIFRCFLLIDKLLKEVQNTL